MKYTNKLNYTKVKFSQNSVERGALGLPGARSINLNLGWSMERCVRLEHGALT